MTFIILSWLLSYDHFSDRKSLNRWLSSSAKNQSPEDWKSVSSLCFVFKYVSSTVEKITIVN